MFPESSNNNVCGVTSFGTLIAGSRSLGQQRFRVVRLILDCFHPH